MKLHQLAAILAASRVSRRSARALANTHGLGGGAGDLSRTLELIEAHAERDEIYRLAIIASAGRDDPSRQPLATIMWLHPAEDHAAWLAAGLGDWPDYQPYADRIHSSVETIRAQGHAVEIRRTSVADFLEHMRSLKLDPNKTQDRAAAIGMLPAEK